MEDNFKIKSLMKNNLYSEAREIALAAHFPEEIIVEISKEHGDSLHSKR